jgi:hypothetical protein
LFILVWPIFSAATGARLFAGIVPIVNALRLYLAASGGGGMSTCSCLSLLLMRFLTYMACYECHRGKRSRKCRITIRRRKGSPRWAVSIRDYTCISCPFILARKLDWNRCYLDNGCG